MHVVQRRVEILDREYHLIIALSLKRKPSDRRLASIAHNGKIRVGEDKNRVVDGSRKVWLYDNGCTPEQAWEAYTSRLKKLGKWVGSLPQTDCW